MVTYIKPRCITLIWRIKNFSLCSHRKGYSVKSRGLGISDEGLDEWQLCMYPRGKRNEDIITVDLVRYANEGGNTVQCEFSLLATDGTAHMSQEADCIGPWAWAVECFVRRIDLEAKKTELLPEDTLTVQCRVWGTSVHPRGAETHIGYMEMKPGMGTKHPECVVENFTTLTFPLSFTEVKENVSEENLPSSIITDATSTAINSVWPI